MKTCRIERHSVGRRILRKLIGCSERINIFSALKGVSYLLYKASANSAARFSIKSFGNLSGSPGYFGSNFCSLANPKSILGSVRAAKIGNNSNFLY